MIWRQSWQTRQQAEVALSEYIIGVYNPRRKHSAQGWKSPLAFEKQPACSPGAEQNRDRSLGSRVIASIQSSLRIQPSDLFEHKLTAYSCGGSSGLADRLMHLSRTEFPFNSNKEHQRETRIVLRLHLFKSDTVQICPE